MKTILLILAISVLVALQVVGYIKWRKGQMSLRRFIGSLGVLIVYPHCPCLQIGPWGYS